MSQPSPAPDGRIIIKAVLFDFMGTCLDWHASISAALPSALSASARSALALEWRQAYFDANTARLESGQAPEDIDSTHRRVLASLLEQQRPDIDTSLFTAAAIDRAIAAWHSQRAWPDVQPALQKLRQRQRRDGHGLELFVHANGTTRLQLNLARASGLADEFDMLFSSQLLGCYKPAPAAYHRVLELLKLQPHECVMVAAHASDTRGARAVGLRTVYVHRWTDDVREDQGVIRGENDAYLEGMDGLDEVIAGL